MSSNNNSMQDSLYIVMPAYNEEENIEKTIDQWIPLLNGKHPSSRLVVADAGSKDRTHEILLDLKEKYPQLEILENTRKEHGPKLIALYNHAINQKADYVFQTDSDGQTNPDEFEAFWNQRDQFDCILGNRTERGDGKSRAMVENVVCLLVRVYFGTKVPDANAPFRLIKREVLEKYMPLFPEDYNLPNIILCACFSKYNEKLQFRPISFAPRTKGVNSINLKKITGIGMKALKDFHGFKTSMKENYEK